jgi:hypothetical protein
MGRSSPRTTLGVYAYPMPNDDESGRKALAEVGGVILGDVHPLCTDGAETDGAVEA